MAFVTGGGSLENNAGVIAACSGLLGPQSLPHLPQPALSVGPWPPDCISRTFSGFSQWRNKRETEGDKLAETRELLRSHPTCGNISSISCLPFFVSGSASLLLLPFSFSPSPFPL